MLILGFWRPPLSFCGGWGVCVPNYSVDVVLLGLGLGQQLYPTLCVKMFVDGCQTNGFPRRVKKISPADKQKRDFNLKSVLYT